MYETTKTTTVTIGAGASLSGATEDMLSLGELVAVITASTWDTAAVTFQASVDGTNFFNVYNEGTEYSLTGVVASAYNRVSINVFLGARYLKVRSGTAGSATNQADATIVTLVFWQVE